MEGTTRDPVTAPRSVAVVGALTFVALIATYALNVTTGLPWLAGHPESVDAIATRRRSPLTHKEIRT